MKLKIALISLLLISFASASLVSFLSNTVTGTAEVRGPIFYLSNDTLITEGGGHLILNKKELIEEGYVEVDGSNTAMFFSDLWNEQLDFYKHDLWLYLDMEFYPDSEPEETIFLNSIEPEEKIGNIKILVAITDENGREKKDLFYSNFINISSESLVDGIQLELEDEDLSDLEKNDRIKLQIIDSSGNEFYERIYINEDSRIEVVPKDE